MESSDTRYAQSGDVHIAYRVFGAGPPDLVFASGLDFPSVEFHEEFSGDDFGELTDRMRVIRFDKRGTGASDRVSAWGSETRFAVWPPRWAGLDSFPFP